MLQNMFHLPLPLLEKVLRPGVHPARIRENDRIASTPTEYLPK